MAELTSKLSQLSIFSKSQHNEEVDEDAGAEIDLSADLGHEGSTDITKPDLRVSDALKSFLVKNNVLSSKEAGPGHGSTSASTALKALLAKPHVHVPPELTDRSRPLPEYFISSSHNTYLQAHQLYGSSSATAYETALATGSRCIEIDAWDNDDDHDEPKVTHGYTLVSAISFRAVCETIRDVVDREAVGPASATGHRGAPVFVSLENHCGPHGQSRLVSIMNQVLGHRLLSEAVRQTGHDEQEGARHVSMKELGSKVVVIVEYHLSADATDEDSSSSDDASVGEKEKHARRQYKDKKKAQPSTFIIPELAAMGVYAQSVKPTDQSWFEDLKLKNGPHHHLINVSETKLSAFMPANNINIACHNSQSLMRVFPKGTRISSMNLHPVPFWGVGAQICALNWQTFGAALQINEALFTGTDGFVLKPAALRAGGHGNLNSGTKARLRLHIAGATDIPLPEGRDNDDIKPYLTCTLIHPDDIENRPPKRKTSGYKQHKLKLFHKADENPIETDPLWDETLEWEYQDNELVFVRMLIKSDDSFASNPVLVEATVRLSYVVEGWTFIRMLDLKGRQTACTLLVNFQHMNV